MVEIYKITSDNKEFLKTNFEEYQSCLKENEKDCICMYFNGNTLSEIGQKMGYSNPSVGQVLHKAYFKIHIFYNNIFENEKENLKEEIKKLKNERNFLLNRKDVVTETPVNNDIISIRLKNVLVEHKLHCFEQLQDYSRREVSNWSGMGKKSMSELENLMSSLNLKFGGDLTLVKR